MMKNLTSLSYDLAQNFLFGQELKPLKHICISSIVSFIFKSEKTVNEIITLNLPDIRKFEVIDEWIVMLKNVEKIALEQMSSKHSRYLVRKIVSFTASEIYIFLFKNRSFDRRLFLKNFVYTTQGTINIHKTVLKILENNGPTDALKFEIACYYFVGESVINNCFEKLDRSTREMYFDSVDVDIKKIVPVLYWCRSLKLIHKNYLKTSILTYYWEELEPRLKNFNQTICIYNTLMLWALCYANDVAIPYLCEKYARFNPKRFLKGLFIRDCPDSPHQALSNIYMYLYFDDKGKDLVVYPNQNSTFLLMINSHRWIGLLFNILEDFQECFGWWDYLFIFRNIFENLRTSLRKKLFSSLHKNVLKTYFEVIPPEEKDNMYGKPEFPFLIESLLYKGDNESIQIISDLGIPERFLNNKHIFLTLMEELQFSFIDHCMEKILSSNEAFNLKQNIFINNSYEVCSKFIFGNSFSSLDSFLNWGLSFHPLKDIIKLKTSIPFNSNGEVIRKILFHSEIEIEGCKFQYADIVLLWCLGSNDFVSMYKKRALLTGTDLKDVNQWEIFYQDNENYSENNNKCVSFYQEIKNSILKRKLNFINKLFTWASCAPGEVKSVKRKLKNDDEFLVNICQMNDFKFLQFFDEWCKDEDEENQISGQLFQRYRTHLQQKIN
ncbi:UNVERIFIED_CONTAM: hypothetical protein RMT77_011340 [Armadillidium vulgare]